MSRRRILVLPVGAALLAGAVLAGCSPALNWRTIRPDGSGAELLMPCKPDHLVRSLPLAGATVSLTLLACEAEDVTWALAFADVQDPARVGEALQALQAAAQANVAGSTARPLPLQVAGATPHPASGRLAFEGRLPDGRPVHEQVAVFTKGTRVFQATALGARLLPEAAETFFSALQTPS
jgi:hypothetical protein